MDYDLTVLLKTGHDLNAVVSEQTVSDVGMMLNQEEPLIFWTSLKGGKFTVPRDNVAAIFSRVHIESDPDKSLN